MASEAPSRPSAADSKAKGKERPGGVEVDSVTLWLFTGRA
jgi:hypothetical protein